MKKIVLALAIILASTTIMSAQKVHKLNDGGSFGAIGAHIGYVGGWSTTVGLHGDFGANEFRGRLGLDLMVGNDFGIGGNLAFHYLFGIVDGLNIYPIAGVDLSYNNYWSSNNIHFGLDLGAGIEYNFTKEWAIFTDCKYDITLAGHDLPYRAYFGVTRTF
ncbi:MAG: hypothetical protein PHD11_04365 [Bacteroidales bacterium]|nr:hypothetical protein [Bacteroidales bacterium]MDD4670467.1 hypothetical protein [Bacteroidales bacterium]